MPSFDINGISVDFPFIPYDVQMAYMTKVIEALQTRSNAVLESPTGTGKTLCLLCATLAWRKYELVKAKSSDSELDGLNGWTANTESEKSLQVPKIIYASRTHSQLSQVVKELKQTSYGKSITISILGSREQMCIHPEVSKQTNNQTMIHMCRNKVSKHLCHFYNNVEDARKNGVFTREVLDIEELVATGLKRNACPYYSGREVSKQPDCAIVFTPYNYLLDRKSRRSQNLDIGGSIIIVDEAHNLINFVCVRRFFKSKGPQTNLPLLDHDSIERFRYPERLESSGPFLQSKEQQCEEASSFDITSLDLANCIDEVGDLLKAVTKFAETGTIADGHEAGEASALSEFKKEELALLKSLFLKLEQVLDEIDLPSSSKSRAFEGKYIFDYFAKVNLTFSTYEVLLEVMDKVSSYLSTLSNSFRTRGTALQRFSEVIKIVFSISSAPSDGSFSSVSGLSTTDELSKYYRVHVCENTATTGKKDLWKKDKATVKSKASRTLSYWCFSPGYAMKDLVAAGARNLILTSGTLTPIDSFVSELQVDFPITLENDHVIDKHQIFVSTMTRGIVGGQLESTFKTRSDARHAVELGSTLAEIAHASPGGLLIFFPSYTAMNHYVTAWREGSDAMKRLELAKQCTLEPKSKHDLKSSIEKFYSDAKTPQGGALLAVCRGKVSEGLDFANDNGRVVVIIGIPFPPSQDPRVKLKMSFLDDMRKKSSTCKLIQGSEWYRLQACRAVNQAIGRVIRHRHDYGAIVLCDHRYTRKDQVRELPKWIQSHVVRFDDCAKSIRRLRSFFCSIREKEKVRLRSLTDVAQPVSSGKVASSSKSQITQSSSAKVTFGGSRKPFDFKTLPRFSEPDCHVPSRSTNHTEIPAMTDGCPSCEDLSSKKRKRDDKAGPSKKNLLEALDECEGGDDLDEYFDSSKPEGMSTQPPVVYNRKTVMQSNMKRKKIKLKRNDGESSSSKLSTTEASDSSFVSRKDEHAVRFGPTKFFLQTVREELSLQSYENFKKITAAYKENGDVNAVMTSLADIFLDADGRHYLLRAFVRFVRGDHQARYSELCLNLTGKRCLFEKDKPPKR